MEPIKALNETESGSSRPISINFTFEISNSELSYAQCCGFERFDLKITVENESLADFKHFSVHFESSAAFLIGLEDAVITGNANSIYSSSNLITKTISLNLNPSFFKKIYKDRNETITSKLLDSEGVVVSEKTVEITIRTMDFWNGNPQSLSVFIDRNNSRIKDITTDVISALNSISGESSLSAYLDNSETSVLNQCAAIYSALQKQKFSLLECDPEEVVSSQNFRSFDEIFEMKDVTTLDITLLYCAVAEQIGLHPIICLAYGLAFPGVWLIEDGIFDTVVHDDPSDITQNSIPSNERICILDSGSIISDSLVSFQEARERALEICESSENIIIVDVRQARLQRIMPLPSKIVLPDGEITYKEEEQGFGPERNTPGKINNYEIGFIEKADNTPKTKIDIWQRKLLDFSTRSPLMNVKIAARSIQILHPDIEAFEDELNNSTRFIMKPNPLVSGEVGLHNETIIRANSELLLSLVRQKKLPTGEDEKALMKKLSQINRKAQNQMSETGVNTLYLSLGHIEWNESKSSQIYCAPVLLYPVDLIRKNKSEYEISLRDDDEPQLNYSIFEKFRTEFGYQTSLDYENLPSDDRGLDIKKIFAILRSEISRQNRWRLVESCVLGLFSFDQFVLWNDMRKKADLLANNKIVDSLIKGEITFDQPPLPQVEDDDFFNEVIPVSCDESQMQAVKAASAGRSFILQGPPGTGKSQTITAMIVDAMAKGKKVLFVAEKMAALQVVFRNLKKVNVSDYLLELHSTKATKAHLIEQLDTALRRIATHNEIDSNRQDRISQISLELSEYVLILHKKTQCGLSLYELINRYESFKDIECVELDYLDIKDTTEKQLEAFYYHLKDLLRLIKKFQPVEDSPYKSIHFIEFDEEQQSELKNRLLECINLIEEIITVITSIVSDMKEQDHIEITLKDLSVVDCVLDDIKQLESMNISIQDACLDLNRLQSALKLINDFNDIKGGTSDFDREWSNQVFSLDVPSLLLEWNNCKTGFFKGKQRKALIGKIDSYSITGGITEANIENKLRELSYALNKMGDVKKAKDAIPLEYHKFIDAEESEIVKVIESINKAQEDSRGFLKLFVDNPSNEAVRETLRALYDNKDCLTAICGKYNTLSEGLDYISNMLEITNTGELDLSELKSSMGYWVEHIGDLYDWANCNKNRRWFKDFTFSDRFVDSVLKTGQLDEVFCQLKASYYRSQIERAIRQNPSLNRYNKESFEEMIQDLSIMEKEYREQLISTIPGMLDDVIRERSNGSYSQTEIFRFISTHGKRRSIRSLFSTCSEYITDICPCFLMSPMSVSQFLEPGKQLFDIVIFDEASQIQTCKAIGAIARGKELIVVGDSKQMPPTGFFQKSVSDDDSEFSIESERLQDLESILDDCETLGLNSTRLSWHYRSSSESLIHFSNTRYYNHKLKTYPSIDSMTSKVRLFRLNRGYYQPGDKEPNPFEAEAIVSAIKKRLNDPVLSKESIGVITFGERQQSLIIKKLDELFERNNRLAKIAHWYESEIDCPDKLIVKNLENIQGDERDVIMLSVTYGKTRSGRFVKNFGPVGRLGGEKRLNVAFSRARLQMEIYTIIDVDEFSSEVLASRGANDLKEFLRFANQKAKIDTSGVSDEIIKKKISESLRKEGFETSFDVGMSDFKIDIAVKNPNKSDLYFCGILLDGTNMTTAKLANDRFVLRRDVLKRRGWKLLQLRTIDWWNDCENELNKIVYAVKETALTLESEKDATESGPEEREEIAVIETSFAGVYRECELDLTPVDSTKVVRQPKEAFESKYKQVVEVEGPIVDDLLELRVLYSFGVKKRGKTIKPFLDEILHSMNLLKTEQIDIAGEKHYVFWPDSYKEYGSDVEKHYVQFRVSSENDRKKRQIQDYPQIEIRNIMITLLKEKGGFFKDTLLEETCRKMGFKRAGKGITDTLNLVYNSAVASGEIIEEGTGKLAAKQDIEAE